MDNSGRFRVSLHKVISGTVWRQWLQKAYNSIPKAILLLVYSTDELLTTCVTSPLTFSLFVRE